MMQLANAANSGYNEIAYDGFEDYNYKRIDGAANDLIRVELDNNRCRYEPHFGFFNPYNDYFSRIAENESHTGDKSLVIDPQVVQTGALGVEYKTDLGTNFGAETAPFELGDADCYSKFCPQAEKIYEF